MMMMMAIPNMIHEGPISKRNLTRQHILYEYLATTLYPKPVICPFVHLRSNMFYPPSYPHVVFLHSIDTLKQIHFGYLVNNQFHNLMHLEVPSF